MPKKTEKKVIGKSARTNVPYKKTVTRKQVEKKKKIRQHENFMGSVTQPPDLFDTWKILDVDDDPEYIKKTMRKKYPLSLKGDTSSSANLLLSTQRHMETSEDYEKRKKRMKPERKDKIVEDVIIKNPNDPHGKSVGMREYEMNKYLKKRLPKKDFKKLETIKLHKDTDQQQQFNDILERKEKTFGAIHTKGHVHAFKLNPEKKRLTSYETNRHIGLKSKIAKVFPKKGKGYTFKKRNDEKQYDANDSGCGIYACQNITDKVKGKKRRIGVTQKSLDQVQSIVNKRP
jgi:hypothetical protein